LKEGVDIDPKIINDKEEFEMLE
jgi:myosin heavy subunit